MEKLSAIAEALDTSLAYLLGEDAVMGSKGDSLTSYKTMKIAVYEMKQITSYNVNLPGFINVSETSTLSFRVSSLPEY